MSLSLNVFGHHADAIVHHLEKSATNSKTADGLTATHRQPAMPKQGHEWRMIRQDTDVAIERGRRDRIGVPLEHRGFRRDNRDMHHGYAQTLPAASCLARATTSSIAPCM